MPQSIVLTDRPIENAKEDQLHFDQYGKALIKALEASETPLTIGIFGPWGSGKTSLMRLIEKKLPVEKYQYVRFDAWKYIHEAALWRALLLQVLREFKPSEKQIEEDTEEDKPQKKLHTKIERLEQALYGDVAWTEKGEFLFDWSEGLKGVASIVSALVMGNLPLLFAKDVVEAAHKGIGAGQPIDHAHSILKAFSRETIEHRQAQLRSIEQFQEKFQDILATALQPGQKLVLFIDDLDRCLPENAIEVLEAIKLFLDVSRCIFFVAIDRQVIVKGVQVRYRDFALADKDSPIKGSDYIEKIVQLPFQLPPLKDGQVGDFVKALDEHLPEEKRLTEECVKVFALGLEPNPRKVKRTLRIFRLLADLSSQLSKAGQELDPTLLAKVVIIQNRYSALYEEIARNPGLLKELERSFRQPDQGMEQKTPAEELPLEVKYRQLEGMFKQKPFFEKLGLDKLGEYIYLTSAASENKSTTFEGSVSEQWWDDLISGDETRIRAAVGGIKEGGKTSVDAYVQRLRSVIEQPATTYSIKQRISADKALILFGDTRDFFESVDIFPGKFIAGEGKRQRETHVDYPFQIGRYQVTNELYQTFVKDKAYDLPKHWSTGTYPKNKHHHPVVHVSWHDATAYCAWLTEKWHLEKEIADTKEVRLPTEDEWELAARGLNGLVYPWGNNFEPSQCNTAESKIGNTTPVGVYPEGASPFGAMDMAGNVMEWTADGDPNMACWVRGGSWADSKDKARCAYQDRLNPAYHSDKLGFRIVVAEVDPKPAKP